MIHLPEHLPTHPSTHLPIHPFKIYSHPFHHQPHFLWLMTLTLSLTHPLTYFLRGCWDPGMQAPWTKKALYLRSS